MLVNHKEKPIAVIFGLFSALHSQFGLADETLPKLKQLTAPVVAPIVAPIQYASEMFQEGPELHAWDRYVRRFRRGHHLSLAAGADQGRWTVGKFGNLSEQRYGTSGLDTTFAYAFHIFLGGKMGYSLGSAAGYFEEFRGSRKDEFTPSPYWKLPGFTAGLVYNYDATGRFELGTEAYLVRFNSLRTRSHANESEKISVTGEAYEFCFIWDAFVTLNAGIRVKAYRREIWIPAPKDSERYLVNARLGRSSMGASIGTVYHFL